MTHYMAIHQTDVRRFKIVEVHPVRGSIPGNDRTYGRLDSATHMAARLAATKDIGFRCELPPEAFRSGGAETD